ncbi:HAMP domain-containing sensor histidine kinase [Methanolacinia paynteri]|uniref:HAMP domain-containing sensor histidine kinase n=1 Tax=Methanolacinia paynteri TaxID=230356 RepID=UPI0006948CFB|nr:HAMP domain-containing sensor histidine kinase [Methanolacinia paynteri]
MSIKNKFSEKLSFLQLLLIICILIVIPISLGLAYDSYKSVSEEYNSNFDLLKNNTEQSIIETLMVVDKGLTVYDEGLDDQMKKGFEPFLSAYDESEGDLSQVDLEAIREGLGEDYNLYVIDENHTITYTTMATDLGLNFSYLEDFSGFLDNIREGYSYVGDRVVKGIREEKTIRKYAYYPTPDHRYVLELSYDIDEDSPRKLLQYSRTIEELKGMNPYLTSVKLYDIFGYTIGEPDEPDKELRKFIINDVIGEKKSVTLEESANGTFTDYRLVNLYEDGIGSDTSLAIAFTYDESLLEDNITSAWYSNLLNIAGLSILLILILSIFCIAISRPLKYLVDDVDKIASGDLDHQIRTGRGGKEFADLEASISNMVERLKKTISKVRESEELIKRQNDELETIVASRTKEALEKSNEANFYLDIITHDINNSNMAALGYAEIMLDLSNEEDRSIVKMMISAIHQNTDIIRNISLMRAMKNGEKDASLSPVNLDNIIRHAISLFPLKVAYEGTGLKVMADKLLEEVFTNILGNSIRHAGSDCEVRISVTESDDDVRICIADNGPGIPDDRKEECFNRYTKNLSGRTANGSGVGLFIVKTLVTERYGGSVRALDAVEGHPEEGLMICVTLRKA